MDAAGSDGAADTGSGEAVDQAADVATGDGPPAQQMFVPWSGDGAGGWKALGTPPSCPSPLIFAPPVPFADVVAVLYPGQTRGNDYKAHGGLRFANNTNRMVTVRAPMSGFVYRGVRYIQAGEVQYLFDIINSCGVMHRLDHLLTLSPRFQAIADTLPPPADTSMTTQLPPGREFVMEGEVIAVAVGFISDGNTFFDWGVYDLRQRNAASADPVWLAGHPGEQAAYGICWLDNFPPAQSAQLRALPGGDLVSGKMSDYCR